MSKTGVLLVYLRDSIADWATDHDLGRYAKLATQRFTALRHRHA